MLIVGITCILAGCDLFPMGGVKYGILIKNNSQKSIYVYASYILPDTAIASLKPSLKELKEGETRSINDHEVGDDKLDRLANEKITLFILSKDSVDKYPWDKIRAEYKILKRYELDNKDLKNMGGIVSYP